MLHNQKMIKSSKIPNKVTEAIYCRFEVTACIIKAIVFKVSCPANKAAISCPSPTCHLVRHFHVRHVQGNP